MTKAQRRELEDLGRASRGVVRFDSGSRLARRHFGALEALGYCKVDDRGGFRPSFAIITDAGREAIKAITAIEER